jgi:dolichyl-phosphate beta-glucosyltransferase
MIKTISIIYPFYNEEKRINKTLKDIKNFNLSCKHIKKEFILVNDGSTDKTVDIISDFIKNNNNTKLLNYKINQGKGFALKKGVEKAKYDWILTSDSDTSVSNFQLLEWISKKLINHKNHIYFGSRNLIDSKVKEKKYRKILGIIFTFITLIFFKIKLKDTQCGFKLYRSKYAKKIFKKIITNGYMHDIEICLISKKLNMKIIELPVKWVHKDNSKISFFRDIFKILYSLLIIKKNEY